MTLTLKNIIKKESINNFKKEYFPKNKKKVLFVSLALISLISYFVYTKFIKTETPTTYTLVEVKKGDILQTVSGSGKVVTDAQVDLKPLSSGQVTAIYVSAGQTVKKGQVIATLDQRSALTSLRQAENNLKTANANYQKTIKGVSDNDKSLYLNSVETSELNLKNSKQNLIDKINSLYIQTLSSVNTTNDLYKNINQVTVTFTGADISFNNSSLFNSATDLRVKIDSTLREWSERSSLLTTDNVEENISFYIGALNSFYDYEASLNNLFVNYASASNASIVDGYKSSTASSMSQAQSSIASLNTALQNVASAKNNLEQSKLSFNSKTADVTGEDKTIQEASLSNARLSLTNAQNSYENTVVRAPFAGVISNINAKVGEIGVSSVATLIADKKIAEIQVGESDIIKIMLGQKVNLTVDAISDKVVIYLFFLI